MERVFTQTVERSGRVFAEKGEIRDYPRATWTGIGRSLNPKDPEKGLAKVTKPVEQLGDMLPKTNRRQAA